MRSDLAILHALKMCELEGSLRDRLAGKARKLSFCKLARPTTTTLQLQAHTSVLEQIESDVGRVFMIRSCRVLCRMASAREVRELASASTSESQDRNANSSRSHAKKTKLQGINIAYRYRARHGSYGWLKSAAQSPKVEENFGFFVCSDLLLL